KAYSPVSATVWLVPLASEGSRMVPMAEYVAVTASSRSSPSRSTSTASWKGPASVRSLDQAKRQALPGGGMLAKGAWQRRSLVSVRPSSGAELLEQPSQPRNSKLVSGAAVRVTAVPEGYDIEQLAPQSMPAGLEVTVPPASATTVSVGWRTK